MISESILVQKDQLNRAEKVLYQIFTLVGLQFLFDSCVIKHHDGKQIFSIKELRL